MNSEIYKKILKFKLFLQNCIHDNETFITDCFFNFSLNFIKNVLLLANLCHLD